MLQAYSYKIEYEDELKLIDKTKLRKPYLKKYLISDFTPEALILHHSNNKKSLTIYVDELNSWIKNFNQLKYHYGRLLGQGNFYKFISCLDATESQNLIHLKRESYNGYIKSYHIENRLREYKEEIVFADEVPESSVEIDTETNEIKFKLTINENQQHPDHPMHAGKVIFKERIVIESGVEYIFEQWQKAKKNLYLTMMPIDNLKKMPTQKRISKLPVPIRKGITELLNNIGKNLDF